MTKRIRKLLGYLLIACLLLSGVSALAETGKITFTVPSDVEKGFTNLKGIKFEIYRVAEPTGTGSAWGPTEDFKDVAFPEVEPDMDGKREWSADQVETMVKQIEAALEGKTNANPSETDENGTIVFNDLKAGIYYIRKSANSRPKKLSVTGALVAVPSLSAPKPYDVTVTAKREYTPPGKTQVTVNKVWIDDSDFDGMQPKSITVHLHRLLGDKEDKEFDDLEGNAQVLNAETSWKHTWSDLEAEDENGVPYTYSVTEDTVANYDAPVIATSEDGKSITVTNPHTPEYGAIRVEKSVQLNGAATTGKQADGTFKFTITGPTDIKEPKKQNADNYLSEVPFEIAIAEGKASSWSRDRLMPGTYKIKEITDGLPEGMSVVGGAERSVEVKAGSTATSPVTVSFVNNQVTGSLKIVKKVTVNGKDTTGKQVDGTYNFTVTGPSYPNGHNVAIKITNGKSNYEQLDNLKFGEYKVEENTRKLPSGVTCTEGKDGYKKTVTVSHTAANPLEFSFTNNYKTPDNPPSTPPTTTKPPTTTPPTTTNPPTTTPPPEETPVEVNVNGAKVWRDSNNEHRTRPASITVELLRNGEMINRITVSGGSNAGRWNYSFGKQPKLDANGVAYTYTVREIEVPGYTSTVRGTSIVNDLIPRTPKAYTSLSGRKDWKDEDDKERKRPNYIVVNLLRNGRKVESRTVTATNGWQFSFQNIPVDDGYGNLYTYTLSEDSVSGYSGRVDDLIVTNSLRPEKKELTELGVYGTPLAGFDEAQLEDLMELSEYGTPLWGRPLKTGDELPLYPIVFGGIGAVALIALVVLMVVNKKRKNNTV